MNRTLRFIGISHKKALVAQRDMYHFSEEEKSNLSELLCHTFSDITGLLILVTCNRTEFYFESVTTSASELIDFLIDLKEPNAGQGNKKLFESSNDTISSVRHLLEVSSGLDSAVLGDAEIIHQIKKAHQFSIGHHLQGSILERALQTTFKNHKRLSNETHFRDGTTSLAYKSLKVAREFFNKSKIESKKILFVGAGDIVKQLFKYNSKFNFEHIFVSNRTEAKAVALCDLHQCEVYSWDNVLANDFEDFDVVISAASNCPNLIKKVTPTGKKRLFIDLAIPENIDKSIAVDKNIRFYNLEGISSELEDNKEKRFAAIDKVKEIIDQELSIFGTWLKEAPLRDLLGEYKILIDQKVKDFFEEDTDASDMKMISNQVMRALFKNPEVLTHSEKADSLITEQIAVLSTQYS